MASTQTPAFAATLFHANGQETIVTYPHKEAGKPSKLTALAFLAVVRSHEVTADVVKLEIFDNRGAKGVLAVAHNRLTAAA